MLILDNEAVRRPATRCRPRARRRQGLRPDPARVKPLLARGATMVLNFIDQLTPELSAFARSLEEALGGRVQANLYLSSKRKQALRRTSTSTTCSRCTSWARRPGACSRAGPSTRSSTRASRAGRGTARPDQGRAVARRAAAARRPALPAARPVPLRARRRRAVRARRLGRHLPDRHGRGQLRLRADGRRSGGRTCRASAARSRLASRRSGGRWRNGSSEPQALEDIARSCANFRWPRDRYDLPDLIERAELAYRVKRAGLRLVSQGGRHGLVKEGRGKPSRCRGRSNRRYSGSSTANGSPSASWPPPSRPKARPASTDCSPTSAAWRWWSPPDPADHCGIGATICAVTPGPGTTTIALGGEAWNNAGIKWSSANGADR